jgi:hypothetical protein
VPDSTPDYSINPLFAEVNMAVTPDDPVSCDIEFLNWRIENFPNDNAYPNNFADGQIGLSEGTHIYSSVDAANATSEGGSQGEFTFICTDGGIRTYSTANSI